ncbi:AAA family ATPase [Bradyrhizobium sp. CB1650]|uniref:tyrosine-protein kinase domain-containing protein n=1 Tax=Bradyrhizobium sp. CB1650 TaxID=3039153 RepID=UPI0024354431|nr:tyrosine-protein kinase domain-containing protein [Bradyrhizobium sp. CB1650]WGD54934.1 AAA family ATPase [Bradyrhizobium sp. CB1650]
MLDKANRRPSFTHAADQDSAPSETWREGVGVNAFLAKVGQRRSMLTRLMLIGAALGSMAGVGYSLVRSQTFSASSELLISNTTLQLSGPDAVVTQILVENSLIQSAIEILRSNSVLERVIDRMGLDAIERILPKSISERAIDRIGRDAAGRLSPRAISEQGPERSDAGRKRAAIRRIRSNLLVARVGASQIISVHGRALGAADAARLTNEIAGAFVEVQNDTNAVVTTSAALRERIKVLGPTARIISEAFPPTSRDGLGEPLVLVLAVGAGGLLGLGAGLAVTFLDRRLRSPKQLVALTSAECFGYVPRQAGAQNDALRDVERATMLQEVALRRVRAAVLERSRKTPRFVGVTSCHDGEGKTKVAAEFAKLISREGERVLFVDASRCSPAISGHPDTAEAAGLQEVLRGTVLASDVIRAQLASNLDFLPSGKALSSPDLLWGNLVSAIAGECGQPYDWVILDLPSLVNAVDVRSAGQILDDLLVVVEWGRASEAQMEQALRALGATRERIVGAVINKAPWSALDTESVAQTRAVCSRAAGGGRRCSEREGYHDEEKVA